MIEVYNQNIVSNFKYTIDAVIQCSGFCLKRLDDNHKYIFRKLENDLKCYVNILNVAKMIIKTGTLCNALKYFRYL